MTKKDYLLVAKTIKDVGEDGLPEPIEYMLHRAAIANALAAAFTKNDPQFDGERFLIASGCAPNTVLEKLQNV